MEFENIRERIKEILEFVESLPEQYRVKTYEVLLTKALIGPPEEPAREEGAPRPEEFRIPTPVLVFLTKYEIPEKVISDKKLFLITGQKINPVYKKLAEEKATAVIQLACLTALENALGGGKFEFALETIRQRARDHKRYDKGNFRRTFSQHKELFESLDDDEHIKLSPDGKTELAEIVLELTK